MNMKDARPLLRKAPKNNELVYGVPFLHRKHMKKCNVSCRLP